MFLSLILFVLIGIGSGIVLGLLPGAHVNNILPLILALTVSFSSPYCLAVFIVALALTQIFISFIPSVFLGAPEADTSLSVLPGHRLLLEGRGYEAIKLTVVGGICSLLLSLVLISALANYFTFLYKISRPYIQYAILLVIIFMIFSEKKLKKMLSAVLIVILSGFLGILTLGSSIVPQQNVLFPVLSGLFGLSTIIVSMGQRSKLPKQKEEDRIMVKKKDLMKSILLGSFAGIIVGFLPAIGVSQAAVMVQSLAGMGETRSFLVTLSGINTANEVFSLSSLYLVNNPRSGASVAIGRILQEVSFNEMVLLIGVICFTAGISSLVTLYLGKKIPKFLVRLNYRYLCFTVILFLIIMVFFITGVYGLLILFTSTSIGLLAVNLGIKRSHCMGCLLIPSLLFFSGVNPFVLTTLRI